MYYIKEINNIFLKQNRNVGLVWTDYFIINKKGKVVHIVKCLNGSRELKAKLLEGNQFGHGSIMLRRECIDNIGTYREEFKLAQDYDFYLRIAEAYDTANISEPLYNWRINIKSVSVKKKMLQDKYALLAIELAKERRQSGKDKLQSLKREEINNFLDSYLISKYEFPNKKEIAQNYCFWSKVLFDGKDYKGAFKLIFKSFISYPLNKETWELAFKDLAILLFPKSIINVLRYIKRSIF